MSNPLADLLLGPLFAKANCPMVLNRVTGKLEPDCEKPCCLTFQGEKRSKLPCGDFDSLPSWVQTALCLASRGTCAVVAREFGIPPQQMSRICQEAATCCAPALPPPPPNPPGDPPLPPWSKIHGSCSTCQGGPIHFEADYEEPL